MSYEVWVARNDRSRRFEGQELGELSVDRLPVRFDDTTRGTIELIDVLWLARNRIEAAFEIEASTSIYSGLLRMADLLAMQPNIDMPLYIVAPDERRSAVFREIRRPVFASLRPPLARACRYLSFEHLEDELERVGGHTRHLRASFVEELAEVGRIAARRSRVPGARRIFAISSRPPGCDGFRRRPPIGRTTPVPGGEVHNLEAYVQAPSTVPRPKSAAA